MGQVIKFVAAALWIVGVTVGAIFFSFQASSARQATTQEVPVPVLGGLDYVKMDIVSVPVLQDSHIVGYFLTRLVYTVEPAKLAKVSIPIDSLIVDEIYSYIYGNPIVDFTRSERIDLDVFRTGVRDAINQRVGDTLVQEVLIEQVDFLSKEEIRDNTIRRKMAAGATAREMTKAFNGHEGGGGHAPAKAPASH